MNGLYTNTNIQKSVSWKATILMIATILLMIASAASFILYLGRLEYHRVFALKVSRLKKAEGNFRLLLSESSVDVDAMKESLSEKYNVVINYLRPTSVPDQAYEKIIEATMIFGKIDQNILCDCNDDDPLNEQLEIDFEHTVVYKLSSTETGYTFKVEIDGISYVLKNIDTRRDDDVVVQYESPYLVTVYMVFTLNMDGESMWMVAEYISDESVTSAWSEIVNNEEYIRKLAHDLVNGLAPVHKTSRMHGDLHGRNILVQRDSENIIERYKIIDFGKSVALYHTMLTPDELRVEFWKLLDIISVFLKIQTKYTADLCFVKGSNLYFPNLDRFLTIVDFYYIIRGKCKNKPGGAYDLLNHPFITKDYDGVDPTDKFGARLYEIVALLPKQDQTIKRWPYFNSYF